MTAESSQQVVLFSKETIPIPEAVSFYSVDNITVPEDRPYIWSMSVSSLDGIISFGEKDALGGGPVALAPVKDSGAGADWRLLNAGWALADAVLGSSSILRDEPHIKWIPTYDDLVEYRVNVLKKSKYPINVILTGRGDVDLKHEIFHHPDLRTVIVTSKSGQERILAQGDDIVKAANTVIEAIGEPTSFFENEWRAVFKLLREKYSVRFLDVTAGGRIISALAELKFVDEMRVTIAGHLIGDSSGATDRARLFVGTKFTSKNNPLLQYKKIGIFGIHHIFVRALLQYRH